MINKTTVAWLFISLSISLSGTIAEENAIAKENQVEYLTQKSNTIQLEGVIAVTGNEVYLNSNTGAFLIVNASEFSSTGLIFNGSRVAVSLEVIDNDNDDKDEDSEKDRPADSGITVNPVPTAYKLISIVNLP